MHAKRYRAGTRSTYGSLNPFPNAQIRRLSAPGRSVLSRNRPDREHRPKLDCCRQTRGYKGRIYSNADGTKLVTVTVDSYATVDGAAAAYREAVAKSEAVPGFGPISIRLNVGRQSFAGTVTMGGETHVGLGALDRQLIVGVTLAGFDATLDDLINLVALARAEDAAANSAAGR
jgi:hypothetical protein